MGEGKQEIQKLNAEGIGHISKKKGCVSKGGDTKKPN